jgi:hypothetical protein
MTIKGGKVAAALWNALAFGLYTYIVVLTATAPVSTIWKVIITAGCNLVGVFCVKLVEEKMRKDRLWKIEMTISNQDAEGMHDSLRWAAIPNHYFIAGNHAVFSCFCESKEQTDTALAIGKSYHAKTFASETTLTP